MLVTVAICTWNRANLLDGTLASLATLRIPPGVEWEVIVVDNNSTDRTRQVIANHAALPLKSLFEPQQGHTRARNLAIRESRGDIVLWTDDDVRVDPEWLAEYVRAAQDYPSAGFFGGWIEPWFERPPPGWIQRNLDKLQGMLVLRKLPQAEGVSRELFFGANMAFRGDLQRANLFDVDLGLQGSNRVVGDETALMANLRARGIDGVWVPIARVQHHTPCSRLTRRYAWQYHVGQGRTGARVEGLRGTPGFLVKLFIRDLYYVARFVLTGNREWLVPFLSAATHWGQLREARAAR